MEFISLLPIDLFTKIAHKMNTIQFNTTKEHYDYMLSESPKIQHRMSLGHVASYLGVT